MGRGVVGVLSAVGVDESCFVVMLRHSTRHNGLSGDEAQVGGTGVVVGSWLV